MPEFFRAVTNRWATLFSIKFLAESSFAEFVEPPLLLQQRLIQLRAFAIILTDVLNSDKVRRSSLNSFNRFHHRDIIPGRNHRVAAGEMRLPFLGNDIVV